MTAQKYHSLQAETFFLSKLWMLITLVFFVVVVVGFFFPFFPTLSVNKCWIENETWVLKKSKRKRKKKTTHSVWYNFPAKQIVSYTPFLLPQNVARGQGTKSSQGPMTWALPSGEYNPSSYLHLRTISTLGSQRNFVRNKAHCLYFFFKTKIKEKF